MPYKDPEIRRMRDRASKAAHKEERRVYDRLRQPAYRQANLEKMRAKDRAYNASHKEQKRIYNRAYRLAHFDKLRRDNQRYQRENLDKLLSYNRAYNKAHPEIMRVAHARYIARKYHAAINDLTPAQWREIKDHYGHCCVYCEKPMQRLSMDHITPISKGGNHTLHNVVPACKSCNSTKGLGPPLIPVQPLLLTIAAAKPKKKH